MKERPRRRMIPIESPSFYPALVVAFTTIVLASQWLFGDEVSEPRRILATVVGIVSVIPIILYFYQAKPPMFPLMATNCLFYFIAFSYAGFYTPTQEVIVTKVTEDGWILGLEIALVGLISQCFGYYFARAAFGQPRPMKFVASLLPPQIQLLAWMNLTARILTVAIPQLQDIPTVGQYAKYTSLIGIGLLTMLYLRGQLPQSQKILFFGIVMPLEFVLRLSTGALYEVVTLIILIVYIRWIITKRTSWQFIVLAFVIFTIFNPVKFKFRELTWNTTSSQQMSAIDKSVLFLEIAATHWLSGDSDQSGLRNNILDRLNHLAMAAIVAESTPHLVDYWHGETLELGLYSFVPRILWPGKPSMTVSNTFGHRYGILAENDNSTTINLTWVVELYCNYGYFAVIFGMACIGAIFAYVERLFCTPGMAVVDVIIPLTIYFPIAYPESNIMMMWGNVLTCSFVTYTIAWFLMKPRE